MALLPLAGLAIAGLAIAFAQATDHSSSEVLFSGQDQLPGLVADAGTWSVGALALVLLLKGVAWSISLAGFSGGPTFPGLYVGPRPASSPRTCPGWRSRPRWRWHGRGCRRRAAAAAVGGRHGDAPHGRVGQRVHTARDHRCGRGLRHDAGARSRRPAGAPAPRGAATSAPTSPRARAACSRGHQLADRRRLHPLVAEDAAARPPHGVVERSAHTCSTSTAATAPPGSSDAARSRSAPARSRSAFAEGALGRLAAFGGVEPEAQQRRDRAPGAAAVEVHGRELVALGVALHEQHVQHAQRAAGLDRSSAPTSAPPKSAPRSNPKTSSWVGGDARRAIRRRGRRPAAGASGLGRRAA